MRNYIKTSKPFELITAVHLIAVLFGLPLAVRQAYYDISFVKYYFYCGSAALLIPALIVRLWKRPNVSQFFKTLSTAEKALLIYWAVSGLSTLFSPYRFEAFWGNEGRLCGFFLMSIYAAAYFVITRCYRPHPAVIHAGLLGGSLVFLLAISDYFNLNLLHFKDHIVPEHASIFMSTLGNINFYAGYGAIILGLAAGLYATWPRTSRTVVYYFLLVLSFVGLIIGNSDNAYLTFGGLLAFFPLYLLRDRRGLRRYLMMVSALLLSFMAVKFCDTYLAELVLAPDGIRRVIDRWDGFVYLCIAFWLLTAAVYVTDYKSHKQDELFSRKPRVLWMSFLVLCLLALAAVLIDANLLGHQERYGSLRNYVVFNNDWGTHRGYIWRKAVENYMKFPFWQKIFGHGPDTYGLISLFKDLPESAGLYGELFDSVHNEYLQFFVTIGPIATAAYIIFLVLSVRDMVTSHCSPYVIGAALAVSCYSAQALVSINQPASTPVMWTLLAMGIAECRKSAAGAIEKDSKQQKGQVWADEKK